MIDIVHEIEAIEREVGTGRLAGGEARVVRLRRTFDAPIDELWDAVTSPERISRWFLPVSGDYRIGGRYQLEGNAGGEILECNRPSQFKVTWVYGEGEPSELEIRLAPADGTRTTLELEHVAIAPAEFWNRYGPGAVGVGWDMGVLGLSLHLRGDHVEDKEAWQVSREGLDYATRSSALWGAANLAAGADPVVVEQNVANTTAFYTTVPEPA